MFLGNNGVWREGKLNFVDENNVFVGYNYTQHCCETFGWFLADSPQRTVYDVELSSDEFNNTMGGFRFDPDYMEIVYNGAEFDAGGMVIFKVTNGNEHKYLHFYNCQNGYYGHGFSMTVNDKVTKQGTL